MATNLFGTNNLFSNPIPTTPKLSVSTNTSNYIPKVATSSQSATPLSVAQNNVNTTFSAPTGYSYIPNVASMGQYTDIIKDPNSAKLYGKLKTPTALPSTLTNVPTSTGISVGSSSLSLQDEMAKQNQLADFQSNQQSDPYAAFKANIDAQLKSYQDMQTKAFEESKALQTKGSELETNILSEIEKLTGKGTRQQELLKQAGVPEAETRLKELNTQMASISAQFDKAYEGLSAGTGLSTTIQGKQGQLMRQKAVELGGLATMAQAVQGNIALAKQTAEETVNLEFQPIEQNIANLQYQLELNYDAYTKKQKEEADAFSQVLQERQRLIDEEKEIKNNISSLAITAAQNGADTATLNKIMKSTDIAEAIQNATSFLSAPGDNKPLVVSAGSSLYDQQGNYLGTAPKESSTGSTVNIGGVPHIDMGNGTFQPVTKIVPLDPNKVAEMDNKISLVNSLLENNNYEKITGIQSPLTAAGLTNRTLIKQYEQLVASLKVDAREKLKGQGQVSNYETKMLADAATMLDRLLPNESFKTELEKIKSAFIGAKNFQNFSAGLPVELSDFYQGANQDTRNKILQIKSQNPNLSDDEVFAQVVPPDWLSAIGITGTFNQGGAGTPKGTVEKANKVLSIPTGTKAGQCGRFVNQITGIGLGDSYQSKLAKMDKSITTPQPGMVFTMPLSGELSKYGHTGFIIGINGDKAIVKDSNWGKDEKVKVHEIPINKMTGFRWA